MKEISGHWLTAKRLRNYPRIFLGVYLTVICFVLISSDGLMDLNRNPIGTDFISFYAAAKLVVSGHPSLVYDFTAHFAAQKDVIGDQFIHYYSYSYPPTFMLILAPLVLLPYIYSFLLWQALTLAFCVAMVRRLTDHKEVIILILAFPAVLVTLGHGQNAFLSTGLFAGGLYYLERKPLIAGLLIGLLTFKPHLGILIPFVLIFGSHWRVFFSAAVTSILFALLSWVVFGSEVWMAFFDSMELTKINLIEGAIPFNKMQSLYAAIRLAGGSNEIAFGFHLILASIASIVVIWVWSIQVDVRLKFSALGIGALMASPFLFDYDLMILAIPLVSLASYGCQHGFNKGLVNLLFITWLGPLFLRELNALVHLPWTSILLSMILAHIVILCRKQKN